MSSTARGGKRSPADNYQTPPMATEVLLRRLRLCGGRWLEPGAGGGAIIRVVNARRGDVQWTAVETRKQCERRLRAAGAQRVVIADFLRWAPPRGEAFAVVLANPPYRAAMTFIERSLGLLRPDGCAVFLLRLGFLATEKRHAFMVRHVPDVYVLPQRPSFRGYGSDSADYAWCVFYPQERSRGKIEILDVVARNPRGHGRVISHRHKHKAL